MWIGNSKKETIRALLSEALHVDGARHKQWYLEQIAKELGISEHDLKRTGKTWDDGIAP
jgi:hypothetical protein